MFVITYKNYFYAFSIFLTLLAIAVFFTWGFKPSIEFTGGSLLEVQYPSATTSDAIKTQLSSPALKGVRGLQSLTIQQTGANTFLLRFGEIQEQEHQQILIVLLGAKERQFQTIGPVIGSELRQKTIIALVLAVIAMFIYVAIAFRKVPAQIRSWRMSMAAIIALFHDVIIAAGGFIIFSHYYGFEAGSLFIAAELTIWGYSISDTIVVFDRIRENLLRNNKKDVKEIAGESIEQTVVRSLNTSLAVLLFVVVLFFIGPPPLLPFVAPLLVGIIIGTYSSIFLATPLLLERMPKRA